MDTAAIFGNLPTIETARLRLRPMTMDDAEDMFAYAANPEVTRYTAWETHRTIDDSRTFLTWVLDQYAAGQIAPWGIEHAAEQRLIGTIGFLWWSTEHARAEFGYAIGQPDWGQGYTTEAARAVVDFGFRVMNLNRIEAQCEPPNIGSARVLEKAGLTYEGTLRQAVYAKGRYRDMALYALLHEDWRG